MKAPTKSNAARTANRGRRASGRRDGGVAHFRELTRVELPGVPRFSQSHLKPPFALFGPLDLRAKTTRYELTLGCPTGVGSAVRLTRACRCDRRGFADLRCVR